MAHHEYLRSEAEVATLEAELAALVSERAGIAARLNALRGREGDAPVGEPVLPPHDELPSLKTLLARVSERPEIQAALFMRAGAKAEEDLMVSDYYPMIMAGIGYQQRYNDEPDSVLGMIGFTVPIFWWDRQDNQLAAARAAVTRREREVAATRIATDADVRAAWHEAWGIQQTLRALDEAAIPKSRQTVESSEAEYASGSGDYLRLLEAITALLGLEMRRLDAVVERETARYELARILGVDLEAMDSQ